MMPGLEVDADLPGDSGADPEDSDEWKRKAAHAAETPDRADSRFPPDANVPLASRSTGVTAPRPLSDAEPRQIAAPRPVDLYDAHRAWAYRTTAAAGRLTAQRYLV